MGCAVTGGAFYRPLLEQFPEEYLGRYFFADYCADTIWTLNPYDANDIEVFATGVNRCIDLVVTLEGDLYYLDRGGAIGGGGPEDNTTSDDGRVVKVSYTGSRAPSIGSQPSDQLLPVGETAHFRVSSSGSQPLSFQWFKDGDPIEGATSNALSYGPIGLEDNGSNFSCEVVNEHGSAISQSAVLSVTENTRPQPEILLPAPGDTYVAGQSIVFAGEAEDLEDGSLGASAFTWTIVFHHDDHTHPGMEPTSGIKSGSYFVPVIGETSANVWYRIYLTVEDSEGLTQTTYRDIYPQTVQLDFESVPAGVPIFLDGSLRETPFSIEGVTGIQRDLQADNPLIVDGVAWRFEGWSFGGDAAQAWPTPDQDTTVIAYYEVDEHGVGAGLTGEYFVGIDNFDDEPTLVREPEVVDFNWASGGPDPSVGVDQFSVRWSGQIQPPRSGLYTFFTRTDDGVRLWVDGELLIDRWQDQAARLWSGNIELEAGRRYSIRLEYYEAFGEASAQLFWTVPGSSREIIPAEHLFHELREVWVETVDHFADPFYEETASWRISRSDSTDEDLEVHFALENPAVWGDDFLLSTGSQPFVVIPAGSTSVEVELQALSFEELRGRLEVALNLTETNYGWGIAEDRSAVVEIRDHSENEWRVYYFGSVENAELPEASDEADWDGDGLPNLLEYALGLDPTVPHQGDWSQTQLEDYEGETYLTFAFTRPSPPPEGLLYEVESSSMSGGSWEPAILLEGYPISHADGSETVKYRDTVPTGEADARFMRLRVRWLD